ncbi:hypothetical protein Tco_0960971 [Tanacetum coccineum]
MARLQDDVKRLCLDDDLKKFKITFISSQRYKFLTIAALYILDKLSEVANSSRLEDKMKVMFSRARDSDESFIDLLHELCFAIRVSITKDRRLIAELEALGQRPDVLKPLEYMREMVA